MAAPRYALALGALTVLFLPFGSITCLNDILTPCLKATFNLNYAKANLIDFCFFGACFMMGILAGLGVSRIGYKGGVLLGFLVACGCFLFYPAAASHSYGLFLRALFVLGTGVVLLQVADASSLRLALPLPVLCYAYTMRYGRRGHVRWTL